MPVFSWCDGQSTDTPMREPLRSRASVSETATTACLVAM